ncbi:BON domain-containing protein [Dichotomicrobium thermohalophilum]|uniref:BON domain-containing protein n=1 Tax=Dichotomicrobium thermohalophilum TaxID=933063 RepID=A0A397Q618_9HYPH|nr:BON domain-containing protein [Dichotomicrobium thermohalophilum]RIA54977.1 BON domain-containing protein [Dichotomicrobium thermohalophilum]
MKARSPGVRRRVWIIGFVSLAVIAGVAVLSARAAIEAEIQSRAAEKLVEAGYSWLDVAVTGRDVVLKGAVFSEHDKDRVEAALREVWGVGNVESQLQVAVREEPYTISMTRSDDELKLRGSVPNEEARKTIIGLANANFPGLDISTKLKIDPNMAETERWLTGVGFALSQLKHVSSGRSVLADTDLSFEGRAAKPGAYEALITAFEEETPQSISVRQMRVQPPKAEPFTWTVQLEGDRVILAGYVPNDDAKIWMTSLAERLFPNADIVDQTFIAKGEPDDWWDAAELAVQALNHLRSGSVTLGPSEVTVEGVAKSLDAQRAISALKDAWPSGFDFKASVRLSQQGPAERPRRKASTAHTWPVQL